MATAADMTSTTMLSWTPAIASDKPTITYRSNVVAVPQLDHTWEPELGVGRGNRVLVNTFTQNTDAANRGAGTGTFGTGAAVAWHAETETQKTLTVNRWYYKAFRQPVEAAEQVLPAYIQLLLKGHGEAIALQVDSDIFSDGTYGMDAATAVGGVDNMDITNDDLTTVETALNNQNAPASNRYADLSPASIGSLRNIESIRNSLYASTVGNLAQDKGLGYQGKVGTFDIHMTNNLETGTSGKKNYFFHKEFMAYAEQLKLQTKHATNMEDGMFMQYLTYMTCGFIVVKNAFCYELAGK